MIRLDGKVIVVTGAGRGIGRAHAELLAARGAAVVIGDLGVDIDGSGRDAGPAQEAADAIVHAGGQAVACAADVSEPEGAQALLQAALDLGGRVDGLVNNAGILSHTSFAETGVAELYRQFDVHVIGTVLVTQALWPHLVRSGGSVVNTTSSGILGAPVSIAYSTAKGAVLSFSRALSTVGAEEGVRVNTLMPGAETRMQSFARERFGGVADISEEARRRSAPELVAPVVAYLMSDDCSLNGETLYAGHGHVRRFVMASGTGIRGEDLTPEMIAEGWEQISRLEPLHVAGDLVSFRDSLGTPLTESQSAAADHQQEQRSS